MQLLLWPPLVTHLASQLISCQVDTGFWSERNNPSTASSPGGRIKHIPHLPISSATYPTSLQKLRCSWKSFCFIISFAQYTKWLLVEVQTSELWAVYKDAPLLILDCLHYLQKETMFTL